MSEKPKAVYLHCEVYETRGNERVRFLANTAAPAVPGMSDRHAFEFIVDRAAEQVPAAATAADSED